jgi:homoserine O-acetyltransferase
MSKVDYYSEAAHGPHEIFELGNYQLQSGVTLPNARIAYKTPGNLNAAKDNVVLFPHMWSGTPKAVEIFIGEDRPLDPRKYFIILPGQFANGFSSSPSNTPPPFNGGAFPHVTIGDDVVAQHRLITERYGINGWNWCSAGRWAPSKPMNGQCASRIWSSARCRSPAPPRPRARLYFRSVA